jgi:hypothetical protein
VLRHFSIDNPLPDLGGWRANVDVINVREILSHLKPRSMPVLLDHLLCSGGRLTAHFPISYASDTHERRDHGRKEDGQQEEVRPDDADARRPGQEESPGDGCKGAAIASSHSAEVPCHRGGEDEEQRDYAAHAPIKTVPSKTIQPRNHNS